MHKVFSSLLDHYIHFCLLINIFDVEVYLLTPVYAVTQEELAFVWLCIIAVIMRALNEHREHRSITIYFFSHSSPLTLSHTLIYVFYQSSHFLKEPYKLTSGQMA